MRTTPAEIAKLIGGRLEGPADIPITGAKPLATAEATDLSYLEKAENAAWTLNRPVGCMIASEKAKEALRGRQSAVIYVDNPKHAFTIALRAFEKELNPQIPPGIHSSAVVDPKANVGKGARIGPHAVIEAGAEIGENAVVSAGCYVGFQTKVGAGSRLYPNVTVRERCVIGKNVILHPGVVIGSDGYGYINTSGKHEKIPQIGIVIIEDDVEIGANAAVDRAALDATVIGAGTKIDNLVHIAHNVRIGKNCLLLAQAAIAGSTSVGNNAIIAGQSGISDHLKIGDNAVVMARTGIMSDLAAGQVVFGTLGRPRLEAMRIEAIMSKLPELYATVRKLKKLLPGNVQKNDQE